MTEQSTRNQHILTLFFLLFSLSLPLSKSVNSIVMGIIYLCFLVSLFRGRAVLRLIGEGLGQPLAIPALLYMGMSMIGLLYTRNLPEGLNVVKHGANFLLIYLMVSVFVDSHETAEKRSALGEILLALFIAGVFLLDVFGVMTYLGVVGNARKVLPLAPGSMHHIWFGNMNAVGLFSAVSFALFSRFRKLPAVKAGLSVFVLLGLASVLLSTSRTAWLGMLCTAVVFIYFLAEDKKIFIGAVLSIVILSCGLFVFSGIVHQRVMLILSDISVFLSGGTSTSVGDRLMMWKMSLQMFLSNPVFGVGTGGYPEAVNEYVGSGRFPSFLLQYNQPHNMYFLELATNGILGLSALLYLMVKAFSVSKRSVSADNAQRLFGFAALSAVSQFMIAGFTDSLLNIHVLAASFAFVMGVCERKSLTARPADSSSPESR